VKCNNEGSSDNKEQKSKEKGLAYRCITTNLKVSFTPASMLGASEEKARSHHFLLCSVLIGWAIDHDIWGILAFSKEPRRQKKERDGDLGF
jgi:hypothetical protein